MAAIETMAYDDVGFDTTKKALLVVDTDLVIRGVNAAYLQATGREREELLGTPVFEAFPDNPNDPAATGVADLNASFETVFRTQQGDDMLLQRYDIPLADDPAQFVRKFWHPVNTPLRDDSGRVIGAVHQVEDITDVVDTALRVELPSSPEDDDADLQTWLDRVIAFAEKVIGAAPVRLTSEQLSRALLSRLVIHQAAGLIAARDGIALPQALGHLSEQARQQKRRVDDLAQLVLQRRPAD